jgi:hypothetical protein
MTVMRAAWLVPLVLCSACGSKPAGTDPPPKAASGAGAAKACDVSTGDRVTEITSPKYGYGILLPSTEWKLECDRDAVLKGEWALPTTYIALTIQSADQELASLGERERLDTILARTTAAMQENKLTVAAPTVETSENKLTLSFDVEGLVIEGDAMKNQHVFASITPRQGALVLHVSWTGTAAELNPKSKDLLRLITVPFLPL